MSCSNCPRRCDVRPGFCGADPKMPEAASVYAHTGEEPPISGQLGISNIFFAHCNLQCIFCQNHTISRAVVNPENIMLRGVKAIVEATAESLQHTENMVGLVSATQYSNIVPDIVEGLHERGLYPTVVYNSNGYESVETLQKIAPYIDVYLPDYKYSDPDIAQRYSNAVNYPEVAGKALKEMYNQKGSSLATDENGLAFRGLIVRHLVLPGQTRNSIACLEWLADNLSPNIYVSLMAQYFPPEGLNENQNENQNENENQNHSVWRGFPAPFNQNQKPLPDELGRRLRREEYDTVVDAFYRLGFHHGWVQDLEAADNYKPDFEGKTVFKTENGEI